MKHITFSDKSLLSGDEAVATMMEYAVLLADRGRADSIDLRAYNSDGQEVVATFLLDAGTPLMAETANSSMPEPDNDDAISLMRERIARLESPRAALPGDPSEHQQFTDEFGF
jgi:hypothetical protein